MKIKLQTKSNTNIFNMDNENTESKIAQPVHERGSRRRRIRAAFEDAVLYGALVVIVPVVIVYVCVTGDVFWLPH